MNRPKVMLVDGNNVVMRSYFAMGNSNLRTTDGKPSGALYGTLKALRAYIADVNPTHMLWLFDSGKSEMRLRLREDYKGHRKYSSQGMNLSPNEDLPPQYLALQEFLDIAGIRHHQERGVEADDLIAYAALTWQHDANIVIVSSDHDMFQLVNNNISVFRPGEGTEQKTGLGMKSMKAKAAAGKLYGYDDVVAKYGLRPEQLSDMWALTGDTGDNIKGIPGVGPKTAAKWLTKHMNLDNVLLREDKCEGFERLCQINKQMIQLEGDVGTVPFGLDDCLLVEPPSPEPMYDFLDSWSIKSFTGLGVAQ